MGKTLAILAAITVLAGCAGTTPVPSRTGATPGQSPAVPVLRWLTGTDGLEMASLLVPRDYAQPAGPQLTIALARLPATDPAQRIGSIVFNPGGPGIPGIDAIRYGADTLFTPAMRALRYRELRSSRHRAQQPAHPVGARCRPDAAVLEGNVTRR